MVTGESLQVLMIMPQLISFRDFAKNWRYIQGSINARDWMTMKCK